MIVSASSLVLYQQQQQQSIAQQGQQQQQQTSLSNQTTFDIEKPIEDLSFEIDNVTFSHHMASVNGIQMHYVIGGQGTIKYQEIQELIAQKNRIERFIANLLNNGEGYSKLQHFVKENVKAVLSENRQVISVSFTALMQTLKANSQLANLIYSISAANYVEQHKDNNVSKYLESNKDRITDLAEKNLKPCRSIDK
jgi:hypothetical protein